jgi:hypothetical protein
MIEICLTTGGSDPHGRERGSSSTRLRRRELLDRRAKALTDQRDRRQGHQTIIVVVGPTKDRACH